MPKAKRKGTVRVAAEQGLVEYRGKQAKTGNSLGFRFDRALFKGHPEFGGEVSAHVIAPGRMLVTARAPTKQKKEEDPVVAAFLAFMAQDMVRSPQDIRLLDATLMGRMNDLVKGVPVTPDENLGDEELL